MEPNDDITGDYPPIFVKGKQVMLDIDAITAAALMLAAFADIAESMRDLSSYPLRPHATHYLHRLHHREWDYKVDQHYIESVC